MQWHDHHLWLLQKVATPSLQPNMSKTVSIQCIPCICTTFPLQQNFYNSFVRWKANPTWTSASVYLGVTLDRSLTFRAHLLWKQQQKFGPETIKLAGSTWGARASTLRTATLALCSRWLSIVLPFGAAILTRNSLAAQFSNADDLGFNHVDTSPVASSFVKYSASLTPPKFSFCMQNLGQNPPVFKDIYEPPEFRLPSKHSIWSAMPSSDWSVDDAWNEGWFKHDVPNQFLITDLTIRQPGLDLNRSDWTILNRHRTSHGRCAVYRVGQKK